MAISSAFDGNSTAREVVAGRELRGKTILITGGSGGLGIEAVDALHAAGATVVVTARDVPRARAALDERDLSDVCVEMLDLESLASVRAFAERWGDQPLDILINNAGIMNVPEGLTVDGFERHIGVNHLAHFLLAELLTPNLARGSESRLVSVSSSAHRLAAWNPEDPHFKDRVYNPALAYAESKSANALFAVGYDARYAAKGIRAFSLMPGVIETGLMNYVGDEDRRALLERMRHVVKTPEQGAATIVWAAVGEELEGAGGLYLENCQVAAPATLDVIGLGIAPHATDPEAADRLWSWSLDQVGLS